MSQKMPSHMLNFRTIKSDLTPTTYNAMLPYLKKNKKRALKLLNLGKEIISEFGKKLN